MEIEAVDLFCGAGGLSFGLKKAGISIMAGFDLDPDCEYAYRKNIAANFYRSDIRKVTPEQVESCFSGTNPRLIAGCAPCQKYSNLTQKLGAQHGRWSLINKFASICLKIMPEFITMENVPNVRTSPEFSKFVAKLAESGYSVWHDVIKCEEFGIAQRRRRLVLLASLNGEIGPLVGSKIRRTVEDTIKSLPRIDAGSTCKKDKLHSCKNLAPINLERIRHSIPGGSWRDWPQRLKLACHTRESGSSYTPVYGRMLWGDASPTITTQSSNYGSGRFGHPEQDRSISLREAAMLQSFPKAYQFFPPSERLSFNKAGRLIGNAVPPKLAEAIGNHFQKCVDHVQ